jgi:hypothetical protein
VSSAAGGQQTSRWNETKEITVKIEKLQPGMTVYDVGRTKMGNTTLSTTLVWDVYIVSVDVEKKTVVARWNGNQERTYYFRTWSKWREKRPMLVRTGMGAYRLANRAEIAAAKAS